MIAIVCWKWGSLFSALYVNRLQSMLSRNLKIEHRIYCLTDDEQGLDRNIIALPLPAEFSNTPRCRRRMKQYDRAFASMLGRRVLSLDLDMVIVGDITPIVDRPEPLVLWKVCYAGVYSGSFVLYEPGALHGAYAAYAADPDYPRKASPSGVGSDQAMINHYLRGQSVPHWTEADGFRTWFGKGYEKLEHHGMGPSRPELTEGARVVVLGSADKAVMDEERYSWVRECWR